MSQKISRNCSFAVVTTYMYILSDALEIHHLNYENSKCGTQM